MARIMLLSHYDAVFLDFYADEMTEKSLHYRPPVGQGLDTFGTQERIGL